MKSKIIDGLHNAVTGSLDYLPLGEGNRIRKIVYARHGLFSLSKPMTFSAISHAIGDTPIEKIRQLEKEAFSTTQRVAMKNYENPFLEFRKEIASLGGVATEEAILNHFSKERDKRNLIRLCLLLDEEIHFVKGDKKFHDFWTTDINEALKVCAAIESFSKPMGIRNVIQEDDVEVLFRAHLAKQKYSGSYNMNCLKNFLSISKQIYSPRKGQYKVKQLSK